jgi:predicted amidophosphoribosyltransferase
MSCGGGRPDWKVIPAICEVCRKEISSKRMIVSEELQTWLIVWEECWAWCRLGGASGKLNLRFLYSLALKIVILP